MRRAGDEAGFVLVEALAALVVTAIAAAGLLAALGAASDRSEEAAVRSMALRQARHLLAEAAAGDSRALDAEGVLPDARLVWTRQFTPLENNSRVSSVIVEVTWTTRRRTGTTRLETYRLSQP